MATIALAVGTFVGYYTQYVQSFGLPAVQSIIASALVYIIAMKIKARVAPDHFTVISSQPDSYTSDNVKIL